MKTNKPSLYETVVLCILFGFICWVMPAQADLKEIKKYKEAFPDAKPKCIACHKDEKPKKEDGQHDPNDYGAAVLNAAKETTPDTYKQVGPVEDFGKK